MLRTADKCYVVMHFGAMKYIIILMTLLIVPGHSFAEIYKWVDEEGQVHFSDQKPDNQAVSEVQIETEINSYQSVSYGAIKVDTSKFVHNKKVVMFSASWCGYCKKARNYFRAKGIPFTEYDIEKSRSAAARHKKMDATGVPVILYGDKRMNGFSEAGFERMYNKDA